MMKPMVCAATVGHGWVLIWLEVMLMSVAHSSIWGHIDVHDQWHHLKPCGCPRTMLQARGHVDMNDRCRHLRPCWCPWSVHPLRALCMYLGAWSMSMACVASVAHANVSSLCYSIKGHWCLWTGCADVSVLLCSVGPWWYLNLSCCRGPHLSLWSYCSQSLYFVQRYGNTVNFQKTKWGRGIWNILKQ